MTAARISPTVERIATTASHAQPIHQPPITLEQSVRELPTQAAQHRTLTFLLVGILAVHLLSIALLPPKPAIVMTNLMQTAASLAACVCSLGAARRSSGAGRIFWCLLALAFALWTWAQGLSTYYYGVLGSGPPAISLVSVLFRFYSAPIALLLAMDERRKGEAFDWLRVFDLLQIGTVIFLWYLVIDFGTAWRLQLSNSALIEFIYALNPINWLLALAAILRARFAASPLIRALWRRIALYLLPYAVLAGTANIFAGVWGSPNVTWFDPLWTTPLLIGAFLAGTWDQQSSLAKELSELGANQGRLEAGIMAVIPLTVVLLSTLVAEDQHWAAVATASISLTAFGLRLAVAQIRQQASFQALQASETRYRTLFENNVAGVFRSTLDGRFLDCNEAFARIFGYTREEMLALNAVALYLHPDERTARLAQLRDHGGINNFESTFRKRDGGTVRVIQNVALRTDERGVAIIEGTLLDISERKLLEQQLLQAQKMEAVGRLAGGVAHDFNNLLSVIIGYSDLLVDALPGDAANRARAEGIRGAGERAAALTRQLLAFSRQQVFEPRVLDLRRTVTEMQSLLRRLIGEDVSLVIHTGNVPALVKCDPNQIEQVIMNLAVNARDAMPHGGRLSITIRMSDFDAASAQKLTGLSPGSYVMLSLADTGQGMDRETQARIFEPFFTTKEKGKGTGLGLATTFGIVKQSGGYISFASEPGQGTTFDIYLPRVNESPEPERTARGLTPAGGSESILLVEDETSLRELTTEFLQHGGYEVRAARDAEQALEWMAKGEIHVSLLVTDVVLPGISGPGLAKQLAAQLPSLPVLYVSGYTDHAVLESGILDGELWFLQKPFSRDALLRKVREVLDASVSEGSGSAKAPQRQI